MVLRVLLLLLSLSGTNAANKTKSVVHWGPVAAKQSACKRLQPRYKASCHSINLPYAPLHSIRYGDLEVRIPLVSLPYGRESGANRTYLLQRRLLKSNSCLSAVLGIPAFRVSSPNSTETARSTNAIESTRKQGNSKSKRRSVATKGPKVLPMTGSAASKNKRTARSYKPCPPPQKGNGSGYHYSGAGSSSSIEICPLARSTISMKRIATMEDWRRKRREDADEKNKIAAVAVNQNQCQSMENQDGTNQIGKRISTGMLSTQSEDSLKVQTNQASTVCGAKKQQKLLGEEPNDRAYSCFICDGLFNSIGKLKIHKKLRHKGHEEPRLLSAHFSAVAGASRENLRTRPSQAGLIHHDVIHEDSKADLPVGRHPVSGDPPPSFESGAAQKHLAARTATWQSRYRHKLYKRQSRLETHIAAVHEKLALKSSKSSGSQILPATAVHNQ